MPENTTQIIAVTSPRSVGGVPIFEFDAPITSDNAQQFHSQESDIRSASSELQKLGFTILSTGPINISFTGPVKLFRDVFGVELQKDKKEVTEGVSVEFYAASTEEAERLMQPPQTLARTTEGFAIASPPEYFASPLPPIAPIDPAAYRYLSVPDDVAVILRAARVHRLGVTGRDVVVGMLDTGHYAHPFFNRHGYRVLSTQLGPGASNPGDDLYGHGTGESANIFAAAPDIRLLPVKMGDDSVGAFNVALAATPKPQVITNSWGYDVDHQSWAQLKNINLNFYNYLKNLEAVVANAIASGIVVCFSCGNGIKRGFPSCHPEVISVGGVHVNFPDLTLEASSYASSFASSLYPGRHCPDLCGLTGKAVLIGGSNRAPSIMLPVQPGADLDRISPSTGADNDGWGLFSGTSAACPQVAGVVALLLEKKPGLTPAEVKKKLMDTAIDIKTGTSGTGENAGSGIDDATGAGLVDAKWGYLVAMGDVIADFISAEPEQQRVMLDTGQMPRLAKEFITDIIDTLRSR